jgi:hypothetical protein
MSRRCAGGGRRHKDSVTSTSARVARRTGTSTMQQAISSHVIAVEVLRDIYGDSPERLRELVKNELQELMVQSKVSNA